MHVKRDAEHERYLTELQADWDGPVPLKQAKAASPSTELPGVSRLSPAHPKELLRQLRWIRRDHRELRCAHRTPTAGTTCPPATNRSSSWFCPHPVCFPGDT